MKKILLSALAALCFMQSGFAGTHKTHPTTTSQFADQARHPLRLGIRLISLGLSLQKVQHSNAFAHKIKRQRSGPMDFQLAQRNDFKLLAYGSALVQTLLLAEALYDFCVAQGYIHPIDNNNVGISKWEKAYALAAKSLRSMSALQRIVGSFNNSSPKKPSPATKLGVGITSLGDTVLGVGDLVHVLRAPKAQLPPPMEKPGFFVRALRLKS